MSTDINKQVLTEVQSLKCGFAIQLDETTDVSNCAQLLVFVRYADKDYIRSELLLSNELRTTVQQKEKTCSSFLKTFFKENGLQWSKLVGRTTDGTPAMLGRKSGFQACVKAVSPSVIFVHSFIHRFATAAKLLPTVLIWRQARTWLLR